MVDAGGLSPTGRVGGGRRAEEDREPGAGVWIPLQTRNRSLGRSQCYCTGVTAGHRDQYIFVNKDIRSSERRFSLLSHTLKLIGCLISTVQKGSI